MVCYPDFLWVRKQLFDSEMKRNNDFPSEHLTDHQRQILMYNLCKFAIRYQTGGGMEISPATMKCYTQRMQQFMVHFWLTTSTYILTPIIAHPKHGFQAICDGRFLEQHSREIHKKRPNRLKSEDIFKLFLFP